MPSAATFAPTLPAPGTDASQKKLARDPEVLKRKIKDWMEHYDHLSRNAAPWLQSRQQHWLRWYNDPSLVHRIRGPQAGGTNTNNIVGGRPSLRDWQHVLVSPHGFVNEEARTESMANLIEETTPRFLTRGRQAEDALSERPLESLVDYELAILNPVTEWARDCFVRGYVQGSAPMRADYRVEQYDINLLPRKWDTERFRQRLQAAMDAIRQDGGRNVPPPPFVTQMGSWAGRDNEQALIQFVQWRNQVMQAYGIDVPMPPVARVRKVFRNVGLKLSHIELPDLTYDPTIPTFRDQPRMYQRMVASKRVVIRECQRRNAQARERGALIEPFNLAAIAALPEGISTTMGEYGTAQDLNTAIMNAIGAYSTQQADPMAEDAIEIIETWEPEAAEDGYGWCWIGQRDRAVTNPGYFPNVAPVHPYVQHVHIPTPGRCLGRSSYDYNTADHDHLDTMRGLMADYVSVLVGQPLFRKGEGLLGQTARDLEIRPFAVLTAEPGEEYGPLYNVQQQLDGVMQYLQYCKGEIDQGQGIDDVMRGQSASLNRVGVGEVQLRAQNQAGRPRGEMHRFGTMVSRDLIPLSVMLVYQCGNPDHILNIAGGDPFEVMATDTLWPGMFANHMYMTAALDAAGALVIQQLQETLKVAQETGVFVPGGKAALQALSELWRAQRIPNGDKLLSLASQDLEEAKQQQQAQGQLEQMGQQLATVRKEADALRVKLNLLTAAQSEAMLSQIVQSGGQGGPEEENPEETQQEGGVEEPGESAEAAAPPAGQAPQMPAPQPEGMMPA